MANELVATLYPFDLLSERSMGHDPTASIAAYTGSVAGKLRGLSLPKVTVGTAAAAAGFTFVTTIPGSLTMSTGLTFAFVVSDDGSSAADLGTVVRLGVTVKRLINDETIDIDTAGGTEQTVDVTLSSTTGGVAVATLAVANANLDSAAVGNAIAVRVRRVGTASQDTCAGRVLLYGVHVKNT